MPPFKKYKLGELAEITSSKRIFYDEYVPFGVPFYRSKEIIEQFKGNKLTESLHIKREKYEEIKAKFGVPVENDMLLTSVGTLGIPYLVKPNDEFYFKDGNLTWFRKWKSEINPKYLFYWLRSSFGKEALENNKIGSTQEALTIVALKSIEIELPDLSTQTRIASILSSLDDKIELNRRTNHTLEQIAQILFKKYCVDDIDPENLPEGWEMLTLGDSVSKSNTGADAIQKAPIVDYDSGIRCARVGDMTNKRPYHEWGFCEIEEEYYENFKLLKYDILITRTATLGINTIVWEDINAVFNNGLIRIRINSEFNPLFVYQALQTVNYEIYIERISGDSSTRPNMQMQYLLDFPMLKPPKKLQDEFSKQIESLLSLKYLKEAEIMQLGKLRDTILPKLMSGEIEVNAAEKELVDQ